MSQRLWIETVGCQMNVLDSELVAAANGSPVNGASAAMSTGISEPMSSW